MHDEGLPLPMQRSDGTARSLGAGVAVANDGRGHSRGVGARPVNQKALRTMRLPHSMLEGTWVRVLNFLQGRMAPAV